MARLTFATELDRSFPFMRGEKPSKIQNLLVAPKLKLKYHGGRVRRWCDEMVLDPFWLLPRTMTTPNLDLGEGERFETGNCITIRDGFGGLTIRSRNHDAARLESLLELTEEPRGRAGATDQSEGFHLHLRSESTRPHWPLPSGEWDR